MMVHKITVDEMTVDERTVDEMTVDEMTKTNAIHISVFFLYSCISIEVF